MFNYQAYAHVHSHTVSGKVEHSLKPGTGEEIRGFKVNTSEALDLSATMLNWLDEVWFKDFSPKTSELRKALVEKFDKALAEVQAKNDSVRRKKSSARMAKISELEGKIEKLKSEGRCFFSSKYRQEDAIKALDREVDNLIYGHIPEYRYFPHYDIMPSEVPNESILVDKIRSQVSDIYIISEMTIEKELMLSPAAIKVLYELRSGDMKVDLLRRFEGDYNWTKNLVDNHEEFIKQYGEFLKEEIYEW
jgi:hypothetical protein